LPDSMPLELQIDEEFGVLQQKYDPVIGDHLTHAYELGSVIGGNTLDDEIGAGYTDCIVSFIREKVCPDGIGENFRVLEVGCGIGFLLKNLKDLGADVTGVEPGAQGVVGAEKYGIPIIKDFFPSDKVVGKFDLIITHCVLEHIVDPRNFIKNFDPFLSENGRVIVSVPNEEPYLACGDISTIFHEHWNYFTIGSFTNLLHGIGVSDLTVERSSHGGLLLSVFKMGGATEAGRQRDYYFYPNEPEVF
jgi:SAM-dependent methyltransferase